MSAVNAVRRPLTLQQQILSEIPAEGIRADRLRVKFQHVSERPYLDAVAQLNAEWLISINDGRLRRVSNSGR
jgi:predicted lipid carrier protein YhbT